jgi:hypothetical protein
MKKTPAPVPKDSRPVLEYLHRMYLDKFHQVFATGNECGLYDAICYCREYAATLPKWALDVIRIRQHELMFGGENKNKRHDAWRRRFEDDMADLMRFETVEQCFEHGVQQKVVFAVASRALVGTMAEGQPSTMREAYRRFVDRQKETPLRYYLPRYINIQGRRGDVLTGPWKGTRFDFQLRDNKRFSRRKTVDPAFGVRQLCPPWDPSLLK